ncbi:arginase family protein [Longitalea arenae]|uniref:arginase family protein n=1 Tax=Longitalea arenae TaxID=2812558 RepID=UPI001967337E|nr:arginase family protein [Longitalea arenae]
MAGKRFDIEIIAAPSILGLRPTGVQDLAKTLLAAGLAGRLQVELPVREVQTLNDFYNKERDPQTHCLNPALIREFSLILGKEVNTVINSGRFAFILGGDCSILIGIMAALKRIGSYGLIFIDAHADFYEPEKSTTGEVADMDLAIVTGRGPAILTNIHDLQPYVKDEHVIHIGQRDIEEAMGFGSRDIRETIIKCFSMADIEERGIEKVMADTLLHAHQLPVESFWIHFDTDVLADDINPAVEYHLPGGLSFSQLEYILQNLLMSVNIAGISVTIYNPSFDPDRKIARNIVESLGRAFDV